MQLYQLPRSILNDNGVQKRMALAQELNEHRMVQAQAMGGGEDGWALRLSR